MIYHIEQILSESFLKITFFVYLTLFLKIRKKMDVQLLEVFPSNGSYEGRKNVVMYIQ